jgi:lysophospholipase L1-like esterase
MSGRLAAAAVLLSAACRSGATEWPVRNERPAGRNVIAFGDSLTQGYGVGAEDGYPAHLSRRLGLPILNAGVSGDTTGDALARLGQDVLARDPRVVLVCLGANDMLRGQPPERQFANLDRIVREIQARGALVVLVGIEGYEGLPPGVDYGARYRALAESTGSVYVPDFLAGVLTEPGLMHDGIHPNGDGYARIAARIAEEAGGYIRR